MSTLEHKGASQPENTKSGSSLLSIEEFYDLLAPNYDAMTSFEKRFEQERPHVQALVDRYHIRTALDAGCGSGFHAVLLSQLGVDVVGVDVSSEMLRLAEANARASNVNLRTLQGSFENLANHVTGRFGSVFVMGNSLAHLLSSGDLECALQNFAAVLETDGLLVVQILNYERIVARRENILNEKHSGEKTFIRSYEYDDAGIRFNITTRERDSADAVEKLQTIRLRPVLREELVALLEKVGFADIRLFGSISLQPFDAVNSKDLVVLATKRT